MGKDMRQKILAVLRELAADRPVYLVGGAVRDQMLDRPAHDLDFVLPGETRGLARALANRLHGALYVLDEERDTTRVVLGAGGPADDRLLLDFASLRAADLEGDLRARDFTINAMAVDVANPERLIDPTGGLADLREGRVRASSPESLSNDPVRVLRAIRLALAFQFKIEPETLKLIRTAAPGLVGPSAERLRDELFRMLDGAQVSLAVRLLDQVGALEFVLPELAALKGVTQSVAACFGCLGAYPECCPAPGAAVWSAGWEVSRGDRGRPDGWISRALVGALPRPNGRAFQPPPGARPLTARAAFSCCALS